MQILRIDIAIIGGGIAGLWSLNQLRDLGYSVALFESEALGAGQTIASQGMIHGGIKYALGGAWSGGSEAIAAMPGAWRACLAGEGGVDLRGCRVLAEHIHLWSGDAPHSRLATLLTSRLVRGRVEKVQREAYPVPLRHPDFAGQVYRLDDLVLDVPSLLTTLAERHREALFLIDWRKAQLLNNGGRAELRLPGCRVQPERLLLAAGAGNRELIASLGGTGPAMQCRPLQQVLVRHQYRQPFFGHCMGGRPSPRITISTHHTGAGEPVWYLGGDLATDGADEEPQRLIDRARGELAALLPWVDLGQTRWRTLRVDRAEPRQSNLLRPDRAFVGAVDGVDNALVAWPTKLSLAPDLGDEIARRLAAAAILPRHQPDLSPLAGLGRPSVAENCWEALFR
jgi:glycerol-3-phosphate dehydrogenase